MKRIVIIAVLCLVAAGAAAPFLPMEFLKPGIARALERGLGRPVEIGAVYLSLYSGPGFSLESVTIHEDPRAGIEPFAYAGAVDARVDFLGLLQGRRGFSNLRFTDATINIVKPDRAAWNFQMLMDAGGPAAAMPSIQMRAGRVNLKLGQTKSVLYLDDADLDVQSAGAGKSVEVRLSGIPLRTDRPRQNSGHFFLRGTATAAPAGKVLTLDVDLEPTSLESLARLAGIDAVPLQGAVSGRARLSGPASALTVDGAVRVDDSRRAQLFDVPFRGSMDLTSQRMELATAGQPAWSVRLASQEMVPSPRWEASLDLMDAPLGPFVAGLRRFAVPIAEKIAAEGVVRGTVSFRSHEGFSGEAEVREAALSLPEIDTIQAATVALKFNGSSLILRPTALTSKITGQTTQIEGSYSTGIPAPLELKIATKSLPLMDAALLGFASAPLLDRASRGTIQGTLRYQNNAWSGEYEVHDAEVAIEGLAEPVRIQSATVSANPERVAVSRMQAAVGAAAVTGDYRWDADPRTAHRFRIRVQQADAAAIERLFLPVLARERGFLARTLRLSGKAVPEWFAARKLEGVISVNVLEAAGYRIRVDTARVAWKGTSISLAGIDAIGQGGAISGDLAVDLSGSVPKYNFEGKLNAVRYKGGDVGFQGTLETTGVGAALLSNLRAEGRLQGHGIGFAEDALFRTVAGRFTLTMPNGAPSWKLSELEVTHGADLYSGEGATQPDGKLALDLMNKGRRVRFVDAAAP